MNRTFVIKWVKSGKAFNLFKCQGILAAEVRQPQQQTVVSSQAILHETHCPQSTCVTYNPMKKLPYTVISCRLMLSQAIVITKD